MNFSSNEFFKKYLTRPAKRRRPRRARDSVRFLRFSLNRQLSTGCDVTHPVVSPGYSGSRVQIADARCDLTPGSSVPVAANAGSPNVDS